MKRKVLIFTASTGQGHNQVASSMKQELELHNCEVGIIEPLKEVSKSLDILVSDGYRVLATKMPRMYGTIYKISNNQILNKPVEKISVKALEDKVEEIVKGCEPDLVISTHPLMVKVMCSLKKSYKYNGPFISIITDYLPHECYLSNLVDAYIVGSDYTKHKVVERGIDESNVFVHGIPINRDFNKRPLTMVKDDKFTILLMGGSMGVSGIKKVYKELLQVNRPYKLIVVCGNNTALKNTLEEKYPINDESKDITILGFTDKISEYMEISDIIITKPGGITVTESFVKNIPIIIPYFIPGQEAENAEMLVEVGAALKIDNIKYLKVLIEELMDDNTILNNLKVNMKNVSKNHSLDNSIELCLQLMGKHHDLVGMKYAK